MSKSIPSTASTVVLSILVVLLLPLVGVAGPLLNSGWIDHSSGVPDKNLRYEDFQITEDGYVTGYIVNSSEKNLPAFALDVWTTDGMGTRILWRKTLTIGNLPPHGKHLVKESYPSGDSDPARTKFRFRLPSSANYRNR
ncbi:MAG TPA: hypothetical protein DCE18_12245 [Syntrophobacteraceae bacterium]|jgi:hypothetical protein|nr:hypothetical protein [Syntrophobacteraceae bacterium]